MHLHARKTVRRVVLGHCGGATTKMTSHARYSGVFDWWFVRQKRKQFPIQSDSATKNFLFQKKNYFKKTKTISTKKIEHVLSWRPAKKHGDVVDSRKVHKAPKSQQDPTSTGP